MQAHIRKPDKGRAMNILGTLMLEKAASADLGGSEWSSDGTTSGSSHNSRIRTEEEGAVR